MKLHVIQASHASTGKRALIALSVACIIGFSASSINTHFGVPAAKSLLRLPPQASMDRFVKADLERADGVASLIVQLNEGNALSKQQRVQLTSLNATVVHELPFVRSVALRLPRQNLARLASAPWVGHLSIDGKVQKADEFTTVASGAVAASAQYGVTGSGVTVAVVDSGIYPSEDLEISKQRTEQNSRIRATVDFVDDGNTTPGDECGHGTHVAGVIAGNGAKSTGLPYYRTFSGIAPRADLVNVRVLDKRGGGDVSDVIAGLEWVVRNKSKYNIRVVNLSLGHEVGESFTTDPLCQAVEQVWKAGIVVVCAAGNDGRALSLRSGVEENSGYGTNYGSIRSPANSPYVITVGATRRRAMSSLPYTGALRSLDQIASYSSRGPSSGDLVLKPDIIAPGDRIISLQSGKSYLHDMLPENQVWNRTYTWVPFSKTYSDDYYLLSGTSIAAPVVAGAAALMIQRDPTLTPDTIKARLMLTADKWGAANGKPDPFTFGAGYLNVANAMRSTIKVQGHALSPLVSLESDGTLRIGQHASVWQNGSFWGTGITNLQDIWGNAVYNYKVFDQGGYLSGAVKRVEGDVFLWGGGSIKRESTVISEPALIGDADF